MQRSNLTAPSSARTHSNTYQNQRRRQRRRFQRRNRIENLEKRELLAADFIVDVTGLDVELERVGDQIRVLNIAAAAPNNVIRTEAVGDIDSKLIDIDARSLLVDSSVDLDGNSLDVTARTITFTAGTITTADKNAGGAAEGNAGDISLAARTISIGPGSVIDTSIPAGAFQPGDVKITAKNRTDIAESILTDAFVPGFGQSRKTSIELDNATILGKDVNISATGQTETRWDDVGGLGETVAGDLLGRLQNLPQLATTTLIPFSGQAKFHSAAADIDLDTTTITSTGNVSVTANANADASIDAIAISGNNALGSPVSIAAAFSQAETVATIDLNGDSVITATGSVDVKTNAKSNAKVESRSEANVGLSGRGIAAAFNLALVLTEETSTIDVGANSQINGGQRVSVVAEGTVANETKAATSIFADGTGALSIALGFDEANITSTVNGTITTSAAPVSGIDLAAANIDAATERITFSGIPATQSVSDGDRVTFTGTADAFGLTASATYIVHQSTEPITAADGTISQSFRLIGAESVNLNDRQVQTGSMHGLSTLSSVRFTTDNVTTEAGSGDGLVALAGLPAGTVPIRYLGPDLETTPDAAAIDALEIGTLYDAVPSGASYKLRLPGTTDFLQIAITDAATHAFAFSSNIQTFHPGNVVDNDKNTITLPAGHGFQTGDLVMYETDDTKTIQRTLKDYDVDGNELSDVGTVTLPDAPIGGLRDLRGYYVIIDPDAPNRIRLATSHTGALAASVVDLNATGTAAKLVTPATRGGITIDAKLDAGNKAEGGVILSDEEQPAAEIGAGVASGRTEKVIASGVSLAKALREKLGKAQTDKAQQKTGERKDLGSGIDVSGTVAVAKFDHDVIAKIGNGATVTSVGDLTVSSDVKQITQLKSDSQATRRGLNDDESDIVTDAATSGSDSIAPEEGDVEISVALAIGLYNNDVQSIIDNNATTNANAATKVAANAAYPLLTENVGDALNPISTITANGLNGFEDINGGVLGIDQIFNVSVHNLVGAEGDRLVLAAGIGVTEIENNVVARIGDNAMVNQNVNLNLHSPSVTVDADLAGWAIEVGHTAAINLNFEGGLESLKSLKTDDKGTKASGRVKNAFKQLGSVFGVQGKKAAGGVLILSLVDNTTIAEIGDSALVAAGGAIDIDATNDYFSLAFVQTGTGSTDFGFAASIAATDFDSVTRASIRDTATIQSDSLFITATDSSDRISIAGAILTGEQVGVGASIGINLVDQTVSAYIGRADADAGGAIPGTTNITVTNTIDIDAIVGGNVFSLVMAGAVQGLKKPAAEAPKTTDASAKKLGPIALSIPVAINVVDANVRASMDGVRASAGSIDIDVKSDAD
ncbi:MAG: hypothetical protein AAFN70_00890, partial [Planctomycetota bacterium]